MLPYISKFTCVRLQNHPALKIEIFIAQAFSFFNGETERTTKGLVTKCDMA